MSLINPNTADKWGIPGGCRAFPHVSQCYQSEETDDKRRGRAAHWVAQQMIYAHIYGGEFPLLRQDLIDPAGYIIDKELYDSAQIYASDVVETWRQVSLKGKCIVSIEESLSFPSVHPDQQGRPDFWIWSPLNNTQINTLYIWEYKNGHRSVSPENNYPMINYTSGILDKFGINGHEDQRTTVIFKVVQPHAYSGEGPISVCATLASDLRGHINNLHRAAHEVMSGNVARQSGPHCIDCPARFECEECLNSIYSIGEITGIIGDVLRSPENINTLCIIFELLSDLSNRAESVKKAVEQEIIHKLQKGEKSELKTLKQTYSRLNWTGSYQEIAELGDNLGFNLRKEELITPKQAITNGMNEDTVYAFSESRPTGFTIENISSQKIRSLFYGSRFETK